MYKENYLSQNQSQIALNFLPLTPQEFVFTIYRKAVNANTTKEQSIASDIRHYKLPENPELLGTNYKYYLVSLNKIEDYEPIVVKETTNNWLTLNIMLALLRDQCAKTLNPSDYFVDECFRKKIEIVTSMDEDGSEIIWLEPYFLSAEKLFGFLIGYHFRKQDKHSYSRAVLQKSLNLGSDGRENKNYYADNYGKIQAFITKYRSRLFPLGIDEQLSLSVSWPPKILQSRRLDIKTYQLADEQQDSSQFQGMRRYGPLQPITVDPLICFMYRLQDKRLAHEVFFSLKGEKYPTTFPGMEKMFGFPLEKKHFVGIAINGYETEDLKNAIDSLGNRAENKAILPIILCPWSRYEHTQIEEDYYYRIKHWFIEKKIPVQFVSDQRISGHDGLKWSISNIGLAIFSKLGGMPWKLKPRNEKCLIIGIGQAHRTVCDKISRYYAYSVLSDSSGLYDSIKVLSESDNEEKYLNGLTERIKSVITDCSSSYDKFAIHTSFKLRREETEAINQAVRELESDKNVVALKFNETSKYFGFATWNNSMVPYESSCISLGKRQYLVWFEGLQYHNPTVKRRISRPMHIEFTYPDDLNPQQELDYIQDALNLSGANWRGFNAKTLPISVYYAKLIAEYIGHFDRLKLPEIDIENLPPWFL